MMKRTVEMGYSETHLKAIFSGLIFYSVDMRV